MHLGFTLNNAIIRRKKTCCHTPKSVTALAVLLNVVVRMIARKLSYSFISYPSVIGWKLNLNWNEVAVPVILTVVWLLMGTLMSLS